MNLIIILSVILAGVYSKNLKDIKTGQDTSYGKKFLEIDGDHELNLHSEVKSEKTPKQEEYEVTKAETIACGSTHCQFITKFSVADNVTYGCFEKNLPVIFEYLRNKTFKVERIAFLPLWTRVRKNFHMPNMLLMQQEYSVKCLKIRKYYVNSNQIIVSVGDENMKLVDIAYVNGYVYETLLKNHDIFTLIGFFFDIYEEELDEFSRYKTFLLACVLWTVWKFVKWILKVKFKRHYTVLVKFFNTDEIEAKIEPNSNLSIDHTLAKCITAAANEARQTVLRKKK